MTYANVKLIVAREIRDQLRDRRTLFVIVVLPVLLYPLLGMSFFQVMQFLREQPVRVLVVGDAKVGDLPPLFGENKQFAEKLFDNPQRATLLQVDLNPPNETKGLDLREDAKNKVKDGDCDIALYFPPDFHSRMQAFHDAVRLRKNDPASSEKSDQTQQNATADLLAGKIPSPEIIFTTANEKSQIAFKRLSETMQRWTEIIGEKMLNEAGMPVIALRPFAVNQADVAGGTVFRQAAGWAKILPVMLLLWALTGAFYPAIDLCAGEKERGTLETLLSSPAERSEIVLGKLVTIMVFSVLTAILNLLSVAATGWMVLSKMPNFGPPPPMALLWISIALLPVAALFSAICLALAAFARSSKEGQYYLMPVLLVTMPLVVLPMSPGAELNLGYSLIPVTGIVLLLKTLLEGHYLPALQYAAVVIGVTLAACLLAIRWAIDQFNSESVLFYGSERLDLRLWLKHLYRDRKPTPTAAGALCLAVLILMLQFFMNLSLVPEKTAAGLVKAILVPQILVILLPVLLMTFLFTSKPRETLLLKAPHWSAMPIALVMALAIHPSLTLLQSMVQHLYPVDEGVVNQMKWLTQIFQNGNLGFWIVLMAMTPAVCEELAVRGFVLSGLRHMGYKWRAIVLSALFFGLIHGILQQSINAFFVGIVLGYLAVQSGSIWPCMVFHFTNNSLMLLFMRITPDTFQNLKWLNWLGTPLEKGGIQYYYQIHVATALLTLLMFLWISRFSYRKTSEERLHEAILRGQETNPEEKDVAASLASMIK